MLISLIDTGHCSSYSSTTECERMVDRWKEYIIIQKKKNILDFPPVPTYHEIVMLIAVTLLSFLSVCLMQHLLWTALEKGIRGLIEVPACKPGTYISKTVVLKTPSTTFASA